jgi:hypothetical protein
MLSNSHFSGNREIKSRIVRMKLTDGSYITGQVNINRAPGYERVSDIVTENAEQFLVLFSVSVRRDELESPIQYQTLFINRAHIIWAAPDEDQK